MESDPGVSMFPFGVFPTRRATRTAMVCPKDPEEGCWSVNIGVLSALARGSSFLPFFVPDDTRCARNAISKCQSLHIHIEGRPGMAIIAPRPRSGTQEGMKGASSVENLQDLAGRWLTGHRKPGRNGERGA